LQLREARAGKQAARDDDREPLWTGMAEKQHRAILERGPA
jgi:hypothetical protein